MSTSSSSGDQCRLETLETLCLLGSRVKAELNPTGDLLACWVSWNFRAAAGRVNRFLQGGHTTYCRSLWSHAEGTTVCQGWMRAGAEAEKQMDMQEQELYEVVVWLDLAFKGKGRVTPKTHLWIINYATLSTQTVVENNLPENSNATLICLQAAVSHSNRHNYSL